MTSRTHVKQRFTFELHSNVTCSNASRTAMSCTELPALSHGQLSMHAHARNNPKACLVCCDRRRRSNSGPTLEFLGLQSACKWPTNQNRRCCSTDKQRLRAREGTWKSAAPSVRICGMNACMKTWKGTTSLLDGLTSHLPACKRLGSAVLGEAAITASIRVTLPCFHELCFHIEVAAGVGTNQK